MLTRLVGIQTVKYIAPARGSMPQAGRQCESTQRQYATLQIAAAECELWLRTQNRHRIYNERVLLHEYIPERLTV